MAGGAKVRGISIELSADASGIVKGLKSANTQISKTSKELKDVNKLLKLDPGNMTLLKQRTQLLQQQFGNAKTKLEELKKAEADMKANGVDENSEQFRALQREIESTKLELDELSSATGSGSATLAKISQATGDFGEKAESAGKKLLPVTAGIVGLGTAAVKTAADFDSQMSKVGAISGATGEDLTALEEKAREMGASTKFSASEAGEAMEYMAMAGWKTEDMLQGIEGIMNLAAASGEDLGTTSDIVTDALTAFGMSAEESGRFADILAAASSNANTNVSMLGESFKYAAPVAGAMGYSAEDVSVALGLMANSGIKASAAGTSLRTMMTNMAKPTDAMASAMEELGVSLDDGQGNMKSFREVMKDLRSGFKTLKKPTDEQMEALEALNKDLEDGIMTEKQHEKAVQKWAKATYGAEGALKAEAAAALAGKTGMSGLLAIVNASDEDFEKLTSAIDGSEGSAKTMAETMQDNLEGQLTILKSQLQELAISFGKILMPIIRNVVTHIQNLVDKFNSLSDSQKETITKIAGIVAAVAPALIIIGKLSKAISAVTSAMSTLKFAKFMTNPVTLAITAIAALIAGVVLLSKKIRNNNAHLQKFDEKIKSVKDANEELSSSIDKTNQEAEESATQTDANAVAAESLSKKLQGLIKKEEKTAGDKALIKEYVEKLNELVPDLGLAYDEEADALNKTNSEISTNIGLMKEQAKLNAYTDAYTESLKQAAEAEMNLNEAQSTFDEMMAQSPQELQEAIKYMQQYGEDALKTSVKHSAAYIKYADDYVRLRDASNGVTDAQNNLQKANQSAEKWLGKVGDASEAAAQAEIEMQQAADKVKFDNFKQSVKDAFGSSYTTELDNAINKANEAGIQIPSKLSKKMQSGKISVDTAVKKLNGLISFDSAKKTAQNNQIAETLAKDMVAESHLVKTASDTQNNQVSTTKAENTAAKGGKQTAANMASGIESNSYKVGDASNAMVDEVDLSGAVTHGYNSGSATSSNFASGISSNSDSVGKAASSLASTAESNLDGGDSYSIGQAFSRGYLNGINSLAGDIARAAAKVVDDAVASAKRAQNSHSPSKVMIDEGENFTEGYAIGIAKKTRDAISNAKNLARSSINAVSGSPMVSGRSAVMASGGGGAVTNNYFNQTNNSPKTLSASDIYRQSKNLLNLKGGTV